MARPLQHLLLQVRNPDDPMREHEVGVFARALNCRPQRIAVFDLLASSITARELNRFDMVLLGGSGHYSAVAEGPWLDRALDSLRLVHAAGKPKFASCWGFEALARAMGGRVVHDLSRAEVGTHTLFLTHAGRADPVFGPLGETFIAQMGHEDCVDVLPPGATLLASSARLANQAYRFDGLPIYCTQFHPELNRHDMLLRVRSYPVYIEKIAGIRFEQFEQSLRDTPATEALLQRFVKLVFG